MQKKNSKQLQGFTLLEILIVVVIVSITVGFALLAFGDFGAKRRVFIAAEQFANHIKLAQQQAILESGTIGIQLSSYGYKMVRFNSKGFWQNISKKGIYNFQPFPKDLLIKREEFNNSKNKWAPKIIINSSGDTTPFTIYFYSKTNGHIATLWTADNGTIQLKPGDANVE